MLFGDKECACVTSPALERFKRIGLNKSDKLNRFT